MIHYYYNFNIEEYEMLLVLIENEVDVFPVLRDYFLEKSLSPFSNYIKEKYTNLGMTKFMKNNYKEAIAKMKNILF